jgi:hypothetical protein
MLNMAPIFRKYCKPVVELFLNWFVTVVCRDLSRKNKAEVIIKLKKLNPEEAEQVFLIWRRHGARCMITRELKARAKVKKTTIKHAKSMLLKNSTFAP